MPVNSRATHHSEMSEYWANVRRGLLPYSVYTFFVLAYWLSADFHTFAPPSPGSLDERLSLAFATGAGPFVFLCRWGADAVAHNFSMWVLGTIVVLGLFGAIGRGCTSRAASIFGFGAWFLAGFCITGLRIT